VKPYEQLSQWAISPETKENLIMFGWFMGMIYISQWLNFLKRL
jgi:hypothetical protein